MSNAGSPPSIDALLAEWWGGAPADSFFTFNPGAASNIILGGNPPYQISDFLSIYPKFGTFNQEISAFTLGSGVMTGYAPGDTITPIQADASGAFIKVGSVDGSGSILTATLVAGGTGYSVSSNLATTTSGSGTGATVNIVSISVGNLVAPLAVFQLYINLASASLSKNRWLDTWQVAMSLFIAHFLTLYLLSEGNVNSSPGRIAVTGLARGLQISKSAGDVSVSYESIKGLDEFASWNRTEYGQLLATFAKTVGAGPMYIY